jgi:nitrogenase molybdenum-iron protein NifN
MNKHASEGRAVIYGEPELVYSYTKFCIENGIIPVISATGSKNPVIKELYEDIKNKFNEETFIFHDTDFQTIQEKAVEVGANILIGNSDGKFVSEKTGIPQVRMGFPIHDRIGGQRIMHLFYEGGMRLLDEIVNTLLEKKYTDYREKMFNKYYKGVE